jgi:hypothetical protein
MSPPGLTATHPSGGTTDVEDLIRQAHATLDEFGLELSAMKINRLCRTYKRRVARNGHTFRAFLLNSIQVGADERRGSPADPAIARVPRPRQPHLLRFADPTFELALRNLATIEDAAQSLGVKPGDEIKVRRAGARVIAVRRNDVISGGAS